MSQSEHLIFADRQTGKTTYLVKRVVEDIGNGKDAVYVTVDSRRLDYARSVLGSFWIYPEQRRGRVDPERHTYQWPRWVVEVERGRRQRANVYIDDADMLLARALFPGVVGQEDVLATFGVTWPVKALITPKLGAEWPGLGEVKP